MRAWTSELGLAGTYELGLVGAFELGFGTCELGPRTSSNRSQRQRKTYRALSVEQEQEGAESPVPQGREVNHLIGERALSILRRRSSFSKNVRDATAHGQVAAGSSRRHLSRRVADAHAGKTVATNPWMGRANIPRMDEDCLL